MDITKAFKDGWKVFTKYWLESILGLFVIGLVSVITLGILSPVMVIGYNLMLLKAKRGKKISVNDVFSALPRFWGIWGIALLTSLVYLLLAITIIGLIPLMFISAWWMFAQIIMVDKKQGVFESLSTSAKLVRKNNVWMGIIFLGLVGIVAQIGYNIFFVGALLTVPLSTAAFVSGYDNLLKKK